MMSFAQTKRYIYDNGLRKLRRWAGYYDTCEAAGCYPSTAIMPSEFFRYALPFLSDGNPFSPDVLCIIEPQRVIAGQYNQYHFNPMSAAYQHVDAENIMAQLDIACIEYAENKVSPPPLYFQPGDLPVYIAIEGKNRVSLFKQFRQSMFAFVRKIEIPRPDELMLVRLKPFNVWGVVCNGETRILPFSEVALPVYRAYGVKEDNPRWDHLALKKRTGVRRLCTSWQMRP